MSSNQAVKHLAWRAGFGPSADMTRDGLPNRDQLLKQLFSRHAIGAWSAAPQVSRQEMMMSSVEDRRRLNRSNMRLLRAEWLDMLAFPSGSDLREKMALFWHGHFACNVLFPGWAQRQLQTLRTHALGNFRDLLVAISQDAAMLHYLNNQQNRKGQPNENYARELMELFTIGRGHYSEQDVQQAARAFTGWSSNLGGHFIFRRRQHDFGDKVFMGREGAWDGTDIIDIILEQPQTAEYISSRIYRYFVREELNQEHVSELAGIMRDSNYEIGKVMFHLFTRDWFYNPKLFGARIKSPVELVAGMMRTLGVKPEGPNAAHLLLAGMGQLAFRPPSVAGWPGGRQWINSATLPLRINLPFIAFDPSDRLEAILKGASIRFTVPEGKIRKRYDDWTLQSIADHMLCVPYNTTTLVRFPVQGTLGKFSRIMSLPEYQMC